MLATGTMNVEAGLLSAASRASGRRAGLILAVLLAHLLFMASPLHDAQMGVAPAASLAASHATGRWPELVALSATSHHEQGGHCVIEWTTASQGQKPVTPHAVAITSVISGADRQFASPPTVRAIGPPSLGDAQAVLQVFRL